MNNHANNNVLLTEGFITDKFPLLAALGLAGALGSSDVAASPIKASNVLNKFDASSNVEPVNYKKSGSMFDFIKQWEGIRNSVYKDHTGKPTIGIGHYLDNSANDRAIIAALFKNTIDYDELLSGNQKLTNSQVEKLFNFDILQKERLAAKLIPNYKSFNQDTKNAIVNALYRGDLGPQTRKYINAGDWKSAAKEYLNHKNVKSGPEQVKRRMKTNAAIFLQNSLKTA